MKKFIAVSDRRAFTLAELMAVVVIIAILAGIALGSYTKSVERGAFTEAKTLSHQIAAARDTYYYDRIYGGNSASMPTTFGALSLELPGASTISSTYTGKNFTFSISNTSYVKATHVDGGYGLCVYQEANASGKVSEEKCFGATDKGKDFCKSMGYTSPGSEC